MGDMDAGGGSFEVSTRRYGRIVHRAYKEPPGWRCFGVARSSQAAAWTNDTLAAMAFMSGSWFCEQPCERFTMPRGTRPRTNRTRKNSWAGLFAKRPPVVY